MLKSGKREKMNGYYVSVNKLSIEGHTPGLALVVDMYKDIMNVDAAFGIFSEEKRKRCMVIGRSSVEGLNIGSIMRSIGGGGHPNAGSALLRSVNPDEVEILVSELLNGNQHSSIQISDLMSFPVFTITPDLSMKEAALLLREKGCTGIPVAENGKVVGVISRSDISKVRKSSQMKSPVKAYMTRKVKYIDPSSSVVQAVRKMVKHKIGRLPVMQDDKIIGIITRTDAMRYYYDLLPE
jgi:CBS domain-containing protein